MLRKIFRGPLGVLAALSLILWLVFGLAWLASYIHPSNPSHGLRLGKLSVALRHGQLLFTRDDEDRGPNGVDAEVAGAPFLFSETIRRNPVERKSVSLDRALAAPPAGDAAATVPTGSSAQTFTSVDTITPSATASPTPAGSGAAAGVVALPITAMPPTETVLFPGVRTWEQYAEAGPSVSLSGGGWLGGTILLQTVWRRLDVSLALPLLLTAILPLVATGRAARDARDRRVAARHGVEEPFVRVRPPRPRGIGRRLLGVLFASSASVSMVLLIALLALWLYSYRPGGWAYDRGPFPDDSLKLSLDHGQATGSRNKIRPGPGTEVYRDHYILYLACGISTYTGPNYYSWNFRTPLWPHALAAAILPAAWLLTRLPGRRARRRSRRGLCPACGYDLRATSGRCPECGTSMVIA